MAKPRAAARSASNLAARAAAASRKAYAQQYLSQGPISVLVADNPWKLKDKLPGRGRGAEKKYKCLSVDKLMSFPLPELGAPAVLFLWRLAALQMEALQVALAWGFVVKSEIRWEKITTNGCRHFGMGRYVRHDSEVALIATRGEAFPAVRDQRSSFQAKMPTDDAGRIIHSAKPDEFYRIVERMYPGARYVELFARRRWAGWEQYGNQLPRVRSSSSTSDPSTSVSDAAE